MSDDKRDLEQYASEIGKKLGFLIASLNVSGETKEAFFDILDDLTLEQLEKLTSVLETKYLAEETDFVEAELINDLKAIREETFEKLNKLNQETIKRLNV